MDDEMDAGVDGRVDARIDYETVERIVLGLPGVTITEKWQRRHWNVGGKGFIWERPLSKADIKRFGNDPVPAGPLLGLTTEDLHDKEALLAEGITGVFTIAHFDNYPAVLVDLAVVSPNDLRQLIVDAWLAQAPDDIAREYLGSSPERR